MRADVVVVGGGVIGASAAYHLARKGCRDVLVLERGGALGEGSTGRATGGFRAQFGSAINVRLSLRSREKLLAFRDELGADPGYRPCGYLFLASRADQLDALRAARQVQRDAGFHEAREVTPAEIRALNPAVDTRSLLGGSFCATDGFIRPLEILRGYRESAERLGVRFAFATPCIGMRVVGDHIAAVLTTAGEVSTGAVVNAAGAWAAAVAALAGVELPVQPVRRQVALSHPFAELPETMPMTVYVDDGFHLRVRDGRVLLLRASPPPADPFDTSVERGWVAAVLERARRAVPCLARLSIDLARCWAGLYEMSPDGHAILGAPPRRANLYLANGSSGHGVMHAPALGELLAELIVDGATSLDAAALRPSRFAEGEPVPSVELI